jgi:hypothetical protein
MKRTLICFFFAIVLMLSLMSTSCNLPVDSIVNIDWVDFIKINDITYLRQNSDVPPGHDMLTYYTEVKFKVADNVNNPNYKIKDGDAAYLETGTKIYTQAGYSPYFRLVAMREQELIIFEADTNPDAAKGSDLLDIGDKVEYIGINSSLDGKTELAAIRNSEHVTELVEMVLRAPVDQTRQQSGSEQYFLEFHLKDGTRVNRNYWLDTGELHRGILLPDEFGRIIRAVLGQYEYSITDDEAETCSESTIREAFAWLEYRLIENEPETFAGLYVEYTPRFHFVVLFTRDAEKTIKPYIPEGMDNCIEVRIVTVSYLTLLSAQSTVATTLMSLGITSESAVYVIENNVEFYVTDLAPVEKAIHDGILSVPSYVEIIKVEGLAKHD